MDASSCAVMLRSVSWASLDARTRRKLLEKAFAVLIFAPVELVNPVSGLMARARERSNSPLLAFDSASGRGGSRIEEELGRVGVLSTARSKSPSDSLARDARLERRLATLAAEAMLLLDSLAVGKGDSSADGVLVGVLSTARSKSPSDSLARDARLERRLAILAVDAKLLLDSLGVGKGESSFLSSSKAACLSLAASGLIVMGLRVGMIGSLSAGRGPSSPVRRLLRETPLRHKP
jgi:hypothetical protein